MRINIGSLVSMMATLEIGAPAGLTGGLIVQTQLSVPELCEGLGPALTGVVLPGYHHRSFQVRAAFS